MQSTHATKRTRAHSDPGISTPGREDMEMQQRSTQAEASVQSAVDETATPDQQDVLTTPSIETGTLQESRTPRPTTIATLPDQGVQAKTSIGTSTNALLEHGDQPFVEEAATSRPEETRAKVTPELQLTTTSVQTDVLASTQENATPGPEDTTGLTRALTPMRLVANSPLSCTEQNATSGHERPTGAPQEVPSPQSSTPQSATPGRQDSTGAAAETPPMDALPEHSISASAPEKDATDRVNFYHKYRGIMPPSKFDEFCSTIGRQRDFRAMRLAERSGKDYDYSCDFVNWTPSMTKTLGRKKREILLIEDADIDCFTALDAEFGLDPRFILTYVNCHQILNHGYTSQARAQEEYKKQFHRADNGMAGSWYVARSVVIGGLPWCSSDPSRTAWQSVSRFWDRRGATDEKRPWWREACRDTYGHGSTRIESRIACYCLSDNLRKLQP
jgi:hypothetical protein